MRPESGQNTFPIYSDYSQPPFRYIEIMHSL